MHIKKNLAIAAAVAVLAVPALGATSANASSSFKPSTEIPTGRLTHAYEGHPAGSIIYDGHGPGGAAGASNMENGSIGHVSDNNHPLVDIPASDVGSLNAKVNNVNKTAQASNNATSSNKPVYQNSKTNNNKLAQTGESNTKIKVGIVGVMAVMVSVAFAGVEKFFKRV